MAIKDSIKSLLKTTEGIIVLSGLLLTVLSPFFGPKIWAGATAVAYLLVNLPGVITTIKSWVGIKPKIEEMEVVVEEDVKPGKGKDKVKGGNKN